MDSAPSSSTGTGTGAVAGTEPSRGIYLRDPDQQLVKVIVSGPFGVGKTTIIASLSEIPPLRTEEVMTATGSLVDHLDGVRDKTTTTVGLDYGRISLGDDLALCLFGTPGQRRFRALWEDITRGALGALILADTRRIEDSYEVMGLIEEQGIEYAVALNLFPDSPRYDERQLRRALDLAPHTPLIPCDARDRGTSLAALLALAEHLLTLPQLPTSRTPVSKAPVSESPRSQAARSQAPPAQASPAQASPGPTAPAQASRPPMPRAPLSQGPAAPTLVPQTPASQTSAPRSPQPPRSAGPPHRSGEARAAGVSGPAEVWDASPPHRGGAPDAVEQT